MSEPIRKKINQLASAPTPQNTPASLTSSYLKSNPMVPSTIDEEAEIKKNLSSNPAFLSLIQGKLGTLIGKDSGYIASLSKDVKNRVYSLKAIQQEQMKIEDQFQKELLELEKKFHKSYAPLYEHRKEIVNGIVEPTAAEIEIGKKIEAELGEGEDEEDEDEEEEDEEAGEDKKTEEGEAKEVTGIPQFWLTALENLHPVSDTITERDAEVLSHLKNIRFEYLTQPGFKLVFEFEENPFFSNKTLTKTYYYQEELGYSGDFIYDHAEGEEINWKDPENNVTISVERRKQRNKHTKQTRTIEKLTPIESFFNFFDPPKPPKDEKEELEEEEEEELETRLALDYQIGEEIKDKLIPRAVDWFTGTAVDYDDGEEEYGLDDEEGLDEEDDESEEDDDEEEEDEDEEDGEDEEGSGKAKGKQQPPECKQS